MIIRKEHGFPLCLQQSSAVSLGQTPTVIRRVCRVKLLNDTDDLYSGSRILILTHDSCGKEN